MVLFYCAFLALRSEDLKRPSMEIVDFEVTREKELFAGSVSITTDFIGGSPYSDVSSMITSTMASDCSRRRTLVSLDSRLPCKKATSKGRRGKQLH